MKTHTATTRAAAARLFAFAAFGMLTWSAFGQGQVIFDNYIPGIVDARVSVLYDDGTRALVDGSDPLFRAALLGGPLGTLVATSFSPGDLKALSSPTDPSETYVGFATGQNAGLVDVDGNAARVITGVNWGGVAMVQMVAWYGDYTSYADAISADAPRGFSLPLSLTLPSSPTAADKGYLIGLQPFDIVGVPEPSIFALGAAGVAILVSRGHRRGGGEEAAKPT